MTKNALKRPESPAEGPVLLSDFDSRKGVLTLTLNRPNARNALNEELVDSLIEAFKKAKDNDAVTSVVLRANGKVFCGGMDLKELAAKIRAGDQKEFEAFTGKYIDLLHFMDRMQPKPIIGILQGDAMGLGCTMALLCDAVYATRNLDDINIGFPERRFGGKPWISGYYVMRKVGHATAMEFFRSSQSKDGFDLLKDNVVTLATTPEGLEKRVLPPTIDSIRTRRVGNFIDRQRRERVRFSSPDQPDDYDEMAKQLVRTYERGDREKIKKLSTRHFTEEMFHPEIADQIDAYFAQLAQQREAAEREPILTSKKPPTKNGEPVADEPAESGERTVPPPLPRTDISPEAIRSGASSPINPATIQEQRKEHGAGGGIKI